MASTYLRWSPEGLASVPPGTASKSNTIHYVGRKNFCKFPIDSTQSCFAILVFSQSREEVSPPRSPFGIFRSCRKALPTPIQSCLSISATSESVIMSVGVSHISLVDKIQAVFSPIGLSIAYDTPRHSQPEMLTVISEAPSSNSTGPSLVRNLASKVALPAPSKPSNSGTMMLDEKFKCSPSSRQPLTSSTTAAR